MSGRSAPNRGKKSHRRGLESTDTRQTSSSSHSGRYANREPPPRFLSRHRNGDGRTNSADSRDYYEDHSGRRDSAHKGSGGRLQQGPTGGSPSGRTNNFGKPTSRN